MGGLNHAIVVVGARGGSLDDEPSLLILVFCMTVYEEIRCYAE